MKEKMAMMMEIWVLRSQMAELRAADEPMNSELRADITELN